MLQDIDSIAVYRRQAAHMHDNGLASIPLHLDLLSGRDVKIPEQRLEVLVCSLQVEDGLHSHAVNTIAHKLLSHKTHCSYRTCATDSSKGVGSSPFSFTIFLRVANIVKGSVTARHSSD